MGLSETHLLGQISGTSGNFGVGDFVTSSFTPPNNCLLAVGVSLIENSGSTTDPLAALTISGGGLTYTPKVGITVNPTAFPTATQVYTAPVAAGASMTLTIGTGGRAIGEYCVTAAAYIGYDAGTPTGATASGIQNGGFGGPPTPASITLNAAPASTSVVFGVVGMDKTTAGVTPGATFAEIDELLNTSWGGLESESRTGSTSTTVDWQDLRSGGGPIFNYAAVAIEIRAGANVVNATASDTLTASDSPTSNALLPRATADNLTTTDSPARTAVLPRSTADSVTTADTPTRAALLPRATADALTTTDAPARTSVLPRSGADSLTATNALTRAAQVLARTTADTLTIGDHATGVVPGQLRDLVVTLYSPSTPWTLYPPCSGWVVGSVTGSLPAVSLEYVRVGVAATAGGAQVNPTNDVVQMAFVSPTATPSTGDWKTASWDSGNTNGVYTALCLVGPGGTVQLPVGKYQVWVKITDSPEIPARPAGLLQIY
jgi:hypothetical protein